MTDKRVIAIIGGGAAGLMAAAYAAEIMDPDTDEILLIEQNDRMGKKLRITGKGRCNLTNDCDRDEFLSNVHISAAMVAKWAEKKVTRNLMSKCASSTTRNYHYSKRGCRCGIFKQSQVQVSIRYES